MRYHLRTLLIVTAVAPPVLAAAWIWCGQDVLLVVAIATQIALTALVVDGVSIAAAAIGRKCR
jgi:hypothetical protein